MKSTVARRSFLLLFALGSLTFLFGYFQFHPAQAYPLEPTQFRAAAAALALSHPHPTAAPLSTKAAAPGLKAPAPAGNATAAQTAGGQVAPTAANPALLSLAEFSRQMAGGSPGVLRGLYVAGVMALRIVPQPAGDAAYISTESGTATRFQKADAFGAIGLLAHNTLSGSYFFSLRPGQKVALVYGDGRVSPYQVSEIADFERLARADLRSDFLQLGANQTWTADQVFARFYKSPGRLTLQTCIRQGEAADWGVRFVVADPAQP